jgi:hypothetical protein
MTTFTQHLTIANFTCLFGDFVLLDLFHQSVLPAFIGGLSRTHGESKYFFHGVEILDLSTDEKMEYGIVGRLVKETIVSRSQIFSDGEILQDNAELESAPSSFFVLFLSNHKLLYVRETAGAPSLSTFETTASQFLRKCHSEWINSVYQRFKGTENSVKKMDLFSKYPLPILAITPLSTEASVSAYVEKFRTINTVEVQLLDTNHELDLSGILDDIRSVKDEIGGSKISVKTERSGDVGLNKGNVAKLIAVQAQDGNSRVVLRGKDLAGEKLTAENDSFKVSIQITTLTGSVEKAARKIVEVIRKHISSGLINVRDAPSSAIEKLKTIFPSGGKSV